MPGDCHELSEVGLGHHDGTGVGGDGRCAGAAAILPPVDGDEQDADRHDRSKHHGGPAHGAHGARLLLRTGPCVRPGADHRIRGGSGARVRDVAPVGRLVEVRVHGRNVPRPSASALLTDRGGAPPGAINAWAHVEYWIQSATVRTSSPPRRSPWPALPQHPFDLLDLDALLSDEEKAIRDTVRDVRRRPDPARRRRLVRGRADPRARAGPGARRPRPARACTSRATAAPARAPSATAWPASSSRPATPASARFVSRAGLAGDVRDPALRLRGAEAGVAAPHGRRRGDRLLRPDRARLRLQPGGMRTAAKRDGDDWVLNGTKMWITNGSDRRRRRGVGRAPTTGHPRLRRPDRHPWLLRPRDPPASCRCGPRSPPSSSSRTSACPPTPCCRRSRACAARSPASTRPASASSSARSAPPATASRPRSTTSIDARAVRQADRRLPAHPEEARRHGARARQGLSCSRCTSAGSRTPAALRPEQVSVGKLNNVREALAIARECRARSWAATASPSSTR